MGGLNSIVGTVFEGSRGGGACLALMRKPSDQCVASPSQPLRWSATHALTMVKNPDSRRLATTIIMPNNR